MRAGRRKSSAFGLIELVITLMILAVLGAIALPRYANSVALYRSRAAANRIAGDINLAQWQAKISSAGQTISFSTGSNNYTLPGVTGLAGTSATYTVNLAGDPYQAVLLSVTFGSGSTLTYDRFGQPSTGGTVVVSSGTGSATVTVDPNTGKATVQ